MEDIGDYLCTACLHLQLQNQISSHAASTTLLCSLSLTFLLINIFTIKKSLATLPPLVHREPHKKQRQKATNEN